MAVKTTVNRFAKRLGVAVRRYAAHQGFDPTHVALAGVYDRNTGRVYLDVGVDLPIDRHQWWQGIRDEIRQEFGGVAPSVSEFGLVVQQAADLEAFLDGLNVADNDLDLTDLLNSHG